MILTIKADRRGYQEVIEEVRTEWLDELLQYLNIDIHKKNEMPASSFLEYLQEQKVEIISYPALNAIAVSLDNEKVGEFIESKFTLKKDKEGSYYEIEIECWSIKEDEIDLS